MNDVKKIEKFIQAVLRQTKKLPEHLTTGKLNVDFEYGIVYPEIRGASMESTRRFFEDNIPNLLKFSNTFHKSWEHITKTDQADLWKDTVLHYFTTYGLESIGLQEPNLIYLPDEVSDIPELRHFRAISTVTSEELIETIPKILDSGVALQQSTIEDYFTILNGLMFIYDLRKCKNKEVKTIFQAKSLFLPKNGEEVVRVINYLITGKTLLIKDKATISMFEYAGGILSDSDLLYVKTLLTERAKECASVFYRYKVLFLALRHAGLQKEINKIRRLAKKLWRPKTDVSYLSTQLLADSSKLDELGRLSVFDLAKIYNKLAFFSYVCGEKKETFHELVVVRNGKIFVDPVADFLDRSEYENAEKARVYILNLLRNRLNPKGKKRIVLPEMLELAFPTSEKTFIGDIPLYSCAICPESSVVGIAWEKDDLDLSAILDNTGKIGWNASYKTQENDVLYSGDMTRGGAEALYFASPHSALIMMNVYYGKIPEVDLFISNEKRFSIKIEAEGGSGKSNYIYDPNNIVYSAKLKLDGSSQVLGLYDKTQGGTRFTFVNLNLGYGPVSQGGELTNIALSTLRDRGTSCLKLADIFPTITAHTFEEELKKAKKSKDQAKITRLASSVCDLSQVSKTDILNLVRDQK